MSDYNNYNKLINTHGDQLSIELLRHIAVKPYGNRFIILYNIDNNEVHITEEKQASDFMAHHLHLKNHVEQLLHLLESSAQKKDVVGFINQNNILCSAGLEKLR